jgi:hypothetical protein
MTAREYWDRAVDEMGGLALKLKLHCEEASADTVEQTRTALEAIGDGVEAAFDGLKAALSDPAMKHDVSDVAASLRDAVTNSLAELNAKLPRPDGK